MGPRRAVAKRPASSSMQERRSKQRHEEPVLQSMANRVITSGRKLDFSFLAQQHFQIGDWLKIQGWEKFCSLDVPVYPRLVKSFFEHLRIRPSHIESNVNGTRIVLNEDKISEILQMPKEGVQILRLEDRTDGLKCILEKEDVFCPPPPPCPPSMHHRPSIPPPCRQQSPNPQNPPHPLFINPIQATDPPPPFPPSSPTGFQLPLPGLFLRGSRRPSSSHGSHWSSHWQEESLRPPSPPVTSFQGSANLHAINPHGLVQPPSNLHRHLISSPPSTSSPPPSNPLPIFTASFFFPSFLF